MDTSSAIWSQSHLKRAHPPKPFLHTHKHRGCALLFFQQHSYSNPQQPHYTHGIVKRNPFFFRYIFLQCLGWRGRRLKSFTHVILICFIIPNFLVIIYFVVLFLRSEQTQCDGGGDEAPMYHLRRPVQREALRCLRLRRLQGFL